MPVQPFPEPPDLSVNDPVIRLAVYQHISQEQDYLRRIRKAWEDQTPLPEIILKLEAYMLFWPPYSRKFYWIPELLSQLKSPEFLSSNSQQGPKWPF